MDYKKMSKGLKEKLEKIMPSFNAIRYVRIQENDGFFLIRKTPRDVEQEMNYEDNGYGRPIAIVYGGGDHTFDDCVILHNNKLRKTKTYISKYSINIKESLEFLIDTILEETENEGKELKIESQSLTPIKDLFRAIGLLPEKRGKWERKLQKLRDQLIVKIYKKIIPKNSNKTRFPIKEIQEQLELYTPEMKYWVDYNKCSSSVFSSDEFNDGLTPEGLKEVIMGNDFGSDIKDVDIIKWLNVFLRNTNFYTEWSQKYSIKNLSKETRQLIKETASIRKKGKEYSDLSPKRQVEIRTLNRFILEDTYSGQCPNNRRRLKVERIFNIEDAAIRRVLESSIKK